MVKIRIWKDTAEDAIEIFVSRVPVVGEVIRTPPGPWIDWLVQSMMDEGKDVSHMMLDPEPNYKCQIVTQVMQFAMPPMRSAEGMYSSFHNVAALVRVRD